MSAEPITAFTGEYRWLSNFWPARVMLDGVFYPTVEHAYVAAKTTDPAVRYQVLLCIGPTSVKRFGRTIKLRDDWNDIRLRVMADLVWLKFQEPHLRELLVQTAGRELIEGNTWNDTFWGVCRGVGTNHLGRIIMNVREHIIRERAGP
jgi:ribA/ribD-fused uncharacterized protein